MKPALALHLLSQIMNWSDDRARDEFARLSLMSRLKYDGYGDYLAGVRFVERLAIWLQQFEPGEREAAYGFVARRLIYITQVELNRLVECFVPRVLRPRLVADAAADLGIPSHEIWATDQSEQQYRRRLRRTLIMGLSDGARTDVLRRANASVLSNEQIAMVSQIDEEKWRDLGDELRKDKQLGEEECVKFDRVCLVDDFTASGTSLLRRTDGGWKGKLIRFRKAVDDAKKLLQDDFPITDDATLLVHHYLATADAVSKLRERLSKLDDEWLQSVELTAGLTLRSDVQITKLSEPAFAELIEKYYDAALEDRHHRQSGASTMAYGYGECGLPVVLEHNTPNNRIALLWAETDGVEGPEMRPLFRRRSRHV